MRKKILLIEDDNILRKNTTEILEIANYKVVTAENGKVGVEKAVSTKPDLIICDILMPELDGYGVLQILSRNFELQKIPFIFISSKSNHSDVRRGMNLGASDYITIPFEESELLSSIEARLKIREVFDNSKEDEYSYINDKIKFENLAKVFSHKEKFKYKKDAAIYCEGTSSNHIFYLIRGEIKTYMDNEYGKELITGIFKNRSFFGFTSLIKGRPYNESAVAIKDTWLLKITKKEFLILVKKNPQLAINFMDLLSKNLENVKNHLIHLVYDSVRKKTAETLLELYKENEIIEISRSNLASLIGIAKETLIRTLSEFRKEKVIMTNRKAIKIIDYKKLKQIK